MKKWWRLHCRRLWTQTSPPSSSRSSRFSPGNLTVSKFTVMPSMRPSLLVTTDSVTTRPLLHTICHIGCVWTQKSWLVGQPSTHLLLTRWWLQWLKNSPPRMNARNFSGRSWPLFRRLKFPRFLQALQQRRTCSCCVETLFWRTSTSSPKFLILCGRHRLRETMWWVPNQRSFRIMSVPSDKPTWWLARLWGSSQSSENPRPARKWRHSREAANMLSRCLRESSQQVYESHLSRFVAFCRTKRWHVFRVRSHHFSTYMMHLFRDGLLPSTIISHRTSVASVLRHWVYDPAANPHIKLLVRAFRLERPVQRRIMPKWDLHLVLLSLLRPLFPSQSDGDGESSDDVIPLKWQTLKCVFLLALASARRRSYSHGNVHHSYSKELTMSWSRSVWLFWLTICNVQTE